MKIYTSLKNNVPFYIEGERHSKEEWMDILHLDGIKIEELFDRHEEFAVADTEIKCGSFPMFTGLKFIIGREGSDLTESEIQSLKQEIDKILIKYNPA